MGFNKRYLPPLEELKSIRRRMDDDSRFLEIYLYKPDAVIGSTEAIEYLHKLEKEVQK